MRTISSRLVGGAESTAVACVIRWGPYGRRIEKESVRIVPSNESGSGVDMPIDSRSLGGEGWEI